MYPDRDLITVSHGFIADWLVSLRACAGADNVSEMLSRASLPEAMAHDAETGKMRITLEQIVSLYQLAAPETGDEMMGLWSRKIRAGALKHLCTTLKDASSLPAVLYRFATFWNLLLDDYQFDLRQDDEVLRLVLQAQGEQPIQRFGHMLILKLAHGLLSWAAGYEVPVETVAFAFGKPSFADDYQVVFPTTVDFDVPHSLIGFRQQELGLPVHRNDAELSEFLQRAPRDWIFTGYHEHSMTLQIRDQLSKARYMAVTLDEIATGLGLGPRTLTRRLEQDGTSFRAIKDALRRDMAIRDLNEGAATIEDISQNLGFSSAANFHRAFRRWTGTTPGVFRKSLKH